MLPSPRDSRWGAGRQGAAPAILTAILVGSAAAFGPPSNDHCEDAIGPLPVPSSIEGTVDGAAPDHAQAPPPCPGVGYVFTTGPGVWYSVLGSGSTITAAVTADAYAKMSVYCGPCIVPGTTCCTPLATPGCTDPECQKIVCGIDPFCCDVLWDAICADEASRLCAVCANLPLCIAADFDEEGNLLVTWCSAAGAEYMILVHGGEDLGQFTLELFDDGVACAEASCQPCTADLNDDGAVTAADLVAVILAWGPCQPAPLSCPADLNGDSTVDVQDLVVLILAFGPCT